MNKDWKNSTAIVFLFANSYLTSVTLPYKLFLIFLNSQRLNTSMKKIFYKERSIILLALIIFSIAISCSKKSSTNSNTPPNPPQRPVTGPVIKYLKSAFATSPGNSNQFNYTYDNQHRLIKYTDTVVTASPSLNNVIEYNLNYTGNDTLPDTYTVTIQQGSSGSITLTN